MSTPSRRCWVCDSDRLVLRRASTAGTMRPEDFAITDAHYGRTAAIYRCEACGFLECPDVDNVVRYYEALEDPGYEASRAERRLQSRALLQMIGDVSGRSLTGLRLLDVGAGSGPLVQEALAAGIRAEGVEPSRWLHAQAIAARLPVHHGVLPHPAVTGPYDVVTLIDVIEHTTDPLALLQHAAAVTAPGGLVVLVTPDVESFAASALGWHWWHYRTAHVGYFTRSTLSRLCTRAGLLVGPVARPGWVLPFGYLVSRLERYLPFTLPRALHQIDAAVPFNLYDSLLLVAYRR